MTRSPSEDRRTEGIDGPVYQLNPVCPVPGCGDGHSLQRHHLWRRSDMGGDKWWVKTTDDRLHGNCINVCRFHHRELTDNIARIVYHEQSFWWVDVLNEPLLLLWQPPEHQVSEHLGELISEVQQERDSEAEILAARDKQTGFTDLVGDRPKDDPDLQLVEKLGAEHVLMPGHEPDVCPTCLRKLPRPKDERAPEAKKMRKTYSVAVPMDRWEDGAEVIDTLMDEAQKELARFGLPYGEGRVVRYYVLTAALGLFVTHAGSIMSDG